MIFGIAAITTQIVYDMHDVFEKNDLGYPEKTGAISPNHIGGNDI